MNTKKIAVTIISLVAISIITNLPSGSGNAVISSAYAKGDKIIVFYFHGDFRCHTCTKIEALTKKAVTEGFKKEIAPLKIEFLAVNMDKPANRHFVKDYRLDSKSVIVAEFTGSKQIRWKNLPKIWDYYSDEPMFLAYIRDEIKAYLK
jgi:hypothetical protein